MYQDQNNTPKKISVWLPLLFAIVLVAGILIGMQMESNAPTIVTESPEASLHALGQGKIEEILRYIEAKYVDEVDREALVQEVIEDMLSKLDPHSNYITAEQLREVNEQLEGNFDGIGVEFMMLDDTIVVVAPLAGGPSEAAGILAGDKIVQISDSTIAGVNMDTRDVINMLRGEKGTDVEVGIVRGQEQKVRKFTITRDEIPMHSVDVAYMIDDKTGYIKVNRFSATTYEEFMKGMEKLIDAGMEDLMIDLRHNPGGYLQQATNILSQLFSRKDKLLVYTEGRAVSRSNYESTGRAFFDVDDIVVLIDEGSASASEILAGAIQDHDRGLIVGRRSFGKGLVQEQYKLRDGSALRLTVARYYTPSGRSIQKPYDDGLEAYESEMAHRYEDGELEGEKKVALADSTEYYTDNGRVVYGGGGISPDIFVPIDTIIFNDDYLELRQQVPQFVFRYMDESGEGLNEYTISSFNRKFQVSDELFDQFLAYAKGHGAKISSDNLGGAKAEIKRFIKARIAKHLFDDEGFYSTWNQGDAVVKEALNALEHNNPLTASQK
ncbi:MAG: S41 family peptidase [Phaeodactylibacter sp.]|nr:S41 family peptidase [Phaeodactylibacter sp.]MCB9267662.1 S41 family peptidase [Lewinellaceae bacterium]MCB9290995.1 S41 family peptidase [Lewinellaceae bacterium]